MNEILIIRTKTGQQYAELIAKKIRSFGAKCGIVEWTELDDYLGEQTCVPEKTLLHYRTSGPLINKKAHRLETKGYRIINSPKVLDRTSDKFYSYQWASQKGIYLPLTRKGTPDEIKHIIDETSLKHFILKPVNSIGMGRYCFRSFADDPKIDHKLSQIPDGKIIFQEFVNYLRIYRVIIIGGKTLDQAVFYDEPSSDRWKVSVCENLEMKLDKNPDPKLLSYAKHLADVFESEIAFIDIYETKDGYVLSEINTACDLTLHEKKSGHDIARDIAVYLVSQVDKQRV
jgi:glutathione synthase/RimK-type ligase-like ATP-grasp enzyme